MLAIPTSRTLWYDALRAFLALGVAYHHVNPCGTGWLDQINDMLVVARVPCFYFLAGIFLGRALISVVDTRGTFTQIAMRFRRLIIPAVIFLLLIDSSKIYPLMNLSLHENFFLNSLFWSTTLVTLIAYVCKLIGIHRYRGIALGLLSVISIVVLWRYSYLNIQLFDFNCTLHSIPFVAAGYCIGSGCVRIPNIFRSWVVILLAMTVYLTFVLLDPMSGSPEVIMKGSHRVMLPFLGIYGIFGIFYLIRDRICHDNAWGQIVYYLGQRSLPLYVLIWVNISWIDFYALMPADMSDTWRSIIMFAMTTTASLLLHDMLCLIPGIERIVFGRKRKLQNPLRIIIYRPFCSHEYTSPK